MLNPKHSHIPLSYLLKLQHKHWYNNNRLSTSLNYLICKKLMVDANFQLNKYKHYVQEINQFLQLVLRVGTMRDIVIQWITCIIFNLVAVNDQYRQALQEQFSGADQSRSANEQVSIQILDNLSQSRKQSLKILLHLHTLLNLIKQFPSIPKQTSHNFRHQLQYTLLTTLTYIENKLQIPLQYQQILQQKLKQLTQCNCNCSDYQIQQNIRIKVNQTLFGQYGKQYSIKKLQGLLKSNYNVNINSMVNLIDANYYVEQAGREIFRGCQYHGMEIVHRIVSYLVTQYNKNQLFSQKILEYDRIFQFFMTLSEQRYLSVYVSWSYLLQKYVINQTEFRLTEQGIVKQIASFLYNLGVEHEQFVNLLKFMGNQLINKCKYSQNVVLDIMKKFILNRFLLNPNLFYNYTDLQITQEHLTNTFNKIRLYFYPKKVQNQSSIAHSQKIQSILASLIFSTQSTDRKNKINQSRKTQSNINTIHKKCVIYQLDRTLYHDYQTLYSDLFQHYHQQSRHKRQPSQNISYQLSFSFVKNNLSKDYISVQRQKFKTQTKIIQQTPRAHTQISQQNQNINTLPPKSYKKNLSNVISPRSDKSRKTDITDIPVKVQNDLYIIQQLVAKRRALGTARRLINQKINKKIEQRQKLTYFYTKIHNDFDRMRRQIQSNANKVRIQIELI